MAFAGKWYQTEITGFDEFVAKNAADPSKIAPLAAGFKACGPQGYVEELSPVEGGKLNRKVYINGDLKRDVTAPVGVEFDGNSWDGRPAKILVQKEGEGVFTRTETLPNGTTIVSKSTPNGPNDMTLTIEANGSKIVRKFKRA